MPPRILTRAEMKQAFDSGFERGLLRSLLVTIPLSCFGAVGFVPATGNDDYAIARFLLGFIAALCLWLTLVTSPWAIITGIIAIDRAKRSPSTD